MRTSKIKPGTFILFGLIVLKFVLQYTLIHPVYELQRDEYLHLDQANHLAWGYISVPPMTSWIAYLIKLLGNGIFWVKFFPALFGALTMILVWKIIETLNGKLFACILGGVAILVCVLLRMNILFQPNSMDIFFWTLVYFTVIKYISTEDPKWLTGTAMAFAFGLLAKYNIFFLLLGLLPPVLLSSQRKMLKEKKFYIGLFIALLIVLPNLLWQYRNGFPTFHQLKELADTQLVNVNRMDFIKEQFMMFINVLLVIIPALIALFVYQPFRKYRLIAWSYLIVIALFLFLKAKAYYAVGLYPVLIAFGAVYLEHFFAAGKRKYLKPVLYILVLGLSIPFFLVAFPVISPQQIHDRIDRYKKFDLLRWEDGKEHNMPQDFADMIGWKDLAAIVDSAYTGIADKEHTMVLCDNYGQAGAVNYYSTFKNINAVSFNADYINWIKLDKKIANIIIVKEADDDDSSRQKERPLFDTVRLVGQNNNPYSREQGTKVFLLQGARIDINSLLRKKIEKHKQ